MSGALDGDAEAALVSGAGACLAARFDLAALGEVAAQARHVLVVDILHAVYAEGANLAARDVAVATATGTPTRAATGTRATRAAEAATRPSAAATTSTATGPVSATAASALIATLRPTTLVTTLWAVLLLRTLSLSLSLGLAVRGSTLRSRSLRCTTAGVCVLLICHIPLLLPFGYVHGTRT